jgi:hypothetical protein
MGGGTGSSVIGDACLCFDRGALRRLVLIRFSAEIVFEIRCSWGTLMAYGVFVVLNRSQ